MHCVLNRKELTTEAGFAGKRTKSGTDQVLPPVDGFGGEFTLVLAGTHHGGGILAENYQINMNKYFHSFPHTTDTQIAHGGSQ